MTPDFCEYDNSISIQQVTKIPLGVRLTFSDNSTAEFHALTLRENAPQSIHPVTHEQMHMLTEFPMETTLSEAWINDTGQLEVAFEPGQQKSAFEPGWLKAWSHPEGPLAQRLPAHKLWDRSLQLDEVSVDGNALFASGQTRERFFNQILTRGFSVISGLEKEPETLEKVTALIGPVRETNFGRYFDVKVKPDADSNAYTDMELPVHTDLSTRELAPGIQLLFCLQSEVDGAESILVDGFKVAEFIRDNEPEIYQTLSEPGFIAASRNKDSDYRFHAPVFVHDRNETLFEVRVNPWLRAPLQGPLEHVDRCYKALYYFFELLKEPRWQIQFPLKPGSLVAFNNRRVLHGRTGFGEKKGVRWLRGCYTELDHLYSHYRVINRKNL